MKIEIEIPDYITNEGIKRVWERNFTITTLVEENTLIIKANESGLKSLAYQLLTLAQPMAPSGSHMHYDDINSLEEGSCELIIEKL
jgi:hypothetical protein